MTEVLEDNAILVSSAHCCTFGRGVAYSVRMSRQKSTKERMRAAGFKESVPFLEVHQLSGV